MPPCRMLILTAILPEARTLARRMKLQKSPATIPLWTRDDIALAVVGIRATKLPGLLDIPLIVSPACIVLAGLAGGLASELHLGAIVIDGKNPPSSLLNAGIRVGLIHTSDSIVATSAEKAKLLANTGCIAVDMETAIVRRFAAKRAIPFMSLRAISDTAKQPLNPELLTLVDENGNARIGRALKMICREPGKWRELLALRQATALALRNLADAAELLVSSGWPGKPPKRPAVA